MPRFGPISRADLIKHLRNVGFDGPYAGGRHQFMEKGDIRLILPNPHRGQLGHELLRRILREAEISREDWERL
jgi:predicted RNA binding protein YcfA (HicA-like mRNA interferase family)